MPESLEYKLYIVVLGGRTKKSHIEQHDVRWVVGKKIEDTFSQLRNEWIGEDKGLHIDSYIKIEYVDGYIIKLIKKDVNSSKAKYKLNNLLLYFVNIGAYNPNLLLEQHKFGLIVSDSLKNAKKLAKERWLRDLYLKHNDDISLINKYKGIDDFYSIKTIKEWEIVLIPDKLKRTQLFIPDWYGYMRIDSK